MRSHLFSPTGIEGFDDVVGGLPRGGLITLAGNPGTGKSAFAATFIYRGAVNFGEPGIYASFLEDEERFYDYMRGLGLDLKPLEEKKMFRYLSIPTLLEPGMSMSAAEIVEAVESLGARRLVIDSFTAMSEMFRSPSEARVLLHSLLSRVARQLDCTTILIKEVNKSVYEYSYEDFLSDGVIVMRRSSIEGRTVRTMNIVKMRGVEVRENDLIFSLHGGLKIFKPQRWGYEYVELLLRNYRPLPDIDGKYSSGIQDLDREVGGFPKGSIILFEIDPKVEIFHQILSTFPITFNYVLHRWPALWLPSGQVGPRYVLGFPELVGIPGGELSEFFLILSDTLDVESMPPHVKRIDLIDVAKFNDLVRTFFEKSSSRHAAPPHVRLNIDKLAYRFGEVLLDSLYHISTLTKISGGLSVWTYLGSYPWVAERLRGLIDFHFKVMDVNKRTIIFGVKPPTPLYVVEPHAETGTIRLVPIT